jgi:hypothetical protein
MMGEVVALGWVTLELTNSPFMVGVAMGIRMLPLFFVGVLAGALADLLAQSLLQLSMPREVRGRAGGAWVVAIGLAPLGQLQIGALASLFGVSVALGASGLALVLLAAVTGLLFPRVKRIG